MKIKHGWVLVCAWKTARLHLAWAFKLLLLDPLLKNNLSSIFDAYWRWKRMSYTPIVFSVMIFFWIIVWTLHFQILWRHSSNLPNAAKSNTMLSSRGLKVRITLMALIKKDLQSSGSWHSDHTDLSEDNNRMSHDVFCAWSRISRTGCGLNITTTYLLIKAINLFSFNVK